MKKIVSFEKEEDYLIKELDYERSDMVEPNCFACFGCYTIKRCLGFKDIWDIINCPDKCTLAWWFWMGINFKTKFNFEYLIRCRTRLKKNKWQ